MSDNAGATTETTTADGGEGVNGGGDSGYTPPATQADLDKIIGERLGRERAKYADYDDLKAKATELDSLKETQKTDFERLQESLEGKDSAIADLQTQLAAKDQAIADRELAVTKSDVAREKGVPVESLTGTTREELEASADALVKWRDDQIPKQRKNLRSGSQIQEDLVTAKQRAALAVRNAF